VLAVARWIKVADCRRLVLLADVSLSATVTVRVTAVTVTVAVAVTRIAARLPSPVRGSVRSARHPRRR
jgi:hypothetical protein